MTTLYQMDSLIYKAACLFSRGLGEVEIRLKLEPEKLLEEDIFLIIAAGWILYLDWMEEDNQEEPTKPDLKILK